ncbi:DUF4132 domain-containing protein [Actinomadura sp. WMMB 499]|uniref:DUF4132 domain-containing protein n=1 Tax=Actinomadura sp. WMMB 499 TaxID=1219491 RepID=UPI00159DA3B2|nr:DUF4132 domain-containing protein [Actinomadura sp. WMMB 499]
MESSDADENVLVLPEAWRQALLPRRGGRTPVLPPALRPGAIETVRAAVAASRPAIDAVLAHEESDVGLAESARAYLRGEADVSGAAAIAALEADVRERPRYRSVGRLNRDDVFRDADADWADFLIAEHGLAFAARVFAEIDGVRTVWSGWDERPDRPRSVDRDGWSGGQAPWAEGPAGQRMRALLAAAGDADHAAVVTGLAGHRREPLQRLVVSYLVPSQRDWVQECCRELPSYPLPATSAPELLWCVLGDEDQVKAAGNWASFGDWSRNPRVIYTAIDGAGAAVAPCLRWALDDETDPEVRRLLVGALAVIPTDDAFRYLATRLRHRNVLPALLEMIERFPLRAYRILAELTAGTSERARMAAGLLDAHHCARSAAPVDVGDAVTATIEAVRAARVREASASETPRALRKAGPATTMNRALAAMLPQVLLKDGQRALPAEATVQLVEALTKATPRRRPAARVQEALDALEPRSLFEFGWTLLGTWRTSGDTDRAGWALAQLGWTGGDEAARRLGAMARSWTGQDGIRLPLDALDVLAGANTDIALIQLHLVASKAKPKRLKNRAGTLLRKAAAARGLTGEQLADRLVPDFGLDAAGSMTLDYGRRRFVVGFDERLVPHVSDEAGKPRKTLPKPGVKDDPELAPAAYAAFAGLKKDVRTVAPEQIRRMERAMCEQRRWTGEEFRELFAGHPLVWHIVKRLVWIHEEGGKATAFRPAEDRTFADENDDVLTLPETGDVRIAHPLHLNDLGRWTEVFGDYEIVQPFPQLGRPVDALTDAERAANRLDRVRGVTVRTGMVLGLERRGWRRGQAKDAGVQEEMVWTVPDGLSITLDAQPGFPVMTPGEWPEQTLGSVWTDSGVRFGDLDEVTASELLLVLNELKADAR